MEIQCVFSFLRVLRYTAAWKRGAVGMFCNGFVRDMHQIPVLEFLVY
jgi:hypothetical protein